MNCFNIPSRKLLLLMTLALLTGFHSELFGQETRGTIAGTVSDPQAAPIPNAAVSVMNTATNVVVKAVTNDSGYYEVPLLIPGPYSVTVEVNGFRKALRTGLTLQAGGRIDLRIGLEVGAVSDAVTITAEAPLIDTTGASIGAVVEQRNIVDLPLGVNSMSLARLTPGVQNSGEVTRYMLHSNNNYRDLSTTVSSGVGSNEYYIDGVPNRGMDRRPAALPSNDAIQEFKVETAQFEVTSGHTTGMSVNAITKAGTNEFHGSLTENHNQSTWAGLPFFTRQAYYRQIAAAEAAGNTNQANALRNTSIKPQGRVNLFGGAIGGPVIVPKLFNGRNKLFFFFSMTGVESATQDSGRFTLPTMANRTGDFSQLLNVNPAFYQLYDPLTVRPDPARPTHYIRDPIVGNILPQSRINNPVYNQYRDWLPRTNADPAANARTEPLLNYEFTGRPRVYDYYAYTNRNDYQLSDKHRFFGKWAYNNFVQNVSDWAYETVPTLHSSPVGRRNRAANVDWVYTPTPTTVIDAAFAVNEYYEGMMNRGSVAYSTKPSSVGFPAYIDAQAGENFHVPVMDWAGYRADVLTGQSFGQFYPDSIASRTFAPTVHFTHIRGTHTIRAGFDARAYFRTGRGATLNTSGLFNFGNTFTRRDDDNFVPAGSLGHSWAAFMMGYQTSSSITTADSYATQSTSYGWYLQDSWRTTRKLTLTFGLRAEFDSAGRERFNRGVRGFDPSLNLPIATNAQGAYAANPMAELPASQFRVQGGSFYLDSKRRDYFASELMWLPRGAAAWQFDQKTVLRAGYGLYFDSLNVLDILPNQLNYTRATVATASDDFGQTWRAGNPAAGRSPMTDPFPVRPDGSRFDAPLRDSLGAMSVVGRSFTFIDDDTRRSRQQRWRVGLQRQIGSSYVVEAAYIGTYSDRVNVLGSDDFGANGAAGRQTAALNLNALPQQYWATGLTRNDAIANNLNSNVANPFFISNFASLQSTQPRLYQDLLSNSFFTSPQIRKNQLLRPYPSMSGLAQSYSPVGGAKTHSYEFSVQKRFSKGYNLTASYTHLRQREAVVFLNEFDSAPTWMEGNNGRPHRFSMASVVELPFGKGKPWLNHGLWSALAGGFQVAGVYEWQPGALIGFGNLFYYGNIGDINTGNRTLERWFNTDNFERVPARGPAAFHSRVFPLRIDGLRQDMTNNWNANAQRKFRFKELLTLELRVEAQNLQNRTQFLAPNTDPFSTNFGRVTNSNGLTRNFFVQGRILF